MKASTIEHIQKELSTLIPVVHYYAKLMPIFTILTSISVVLTNACGKSGTDEELTDYFNLVKDWLLALKSHNTGDHFISYVADEVYMIVYGNDMAEDCEDHSYDIDDEPITSTYSELKPNIREENGIQIIDTNGSLWVRVYYGGESPIAYSKYINSKPTADTIYELIKA